MARHLGIDIGTSSVKVLELSDSGSVESQSIFVNPTGKNVSLMTNAEKLTLTEMLKKALAEGGIKSRKAVVSIPEALVYAKVMKFPRMSTPELATAIKWELDQNVPFPPNEVEMSWSLMDDLSKKKAGEEMIAYVVAVPSKISETYVQIFDILELEIERLENESVALQRSLSGFVPENGLMLAVDFGYSGTNIVLASKDAIVNSYYYSVGGLAMTKLIAETFSLTVDQAENYKRTYGLAPDQLDGKMYKLLKPVMDNLVLELKKMLVAYRNDYGEIGALRVVLTGGGAFLAQLPATISTALDGAEVLIGNIFEGREVDNSLMAYGPIYSVANGLAIQL